ncbi:helicase-related protein [Arthrobacter sp. Leaf69]|uniref:helicase-related protein n=1 Tax=Arthrobacter sp. Leaf69 TaxID=1736232 RepID=UPI0019110A80|nr:helicase-related protein [Arthrobacter sp. Leaf69]
MDLEFNSDASEVGGDDLDLAGANQYLPSSLAVTCSLHRDFKGQLLWRVRGAVYRKFNVEVSGTKRSWWVRRPFESAGCIDSREILDRQRLRQSLTPTSTVGEVPNIRLSYFSRTSPHRHDTDDVLTTFVLENLESKEGQQSTVFQVEMQVYSESGGAFTAFPERPLVDSTDEEMAELALLFRNTRTFARGHGCAANWSEPAGDRVSMVWADVLPTYEASSPTPDIRVKTHDGTREQLRLEMGLLAAGDPVGDLQLKTLVDSYGAWIGEQESVSDQLDESYRSAAARNMELCRGAHRRMEAGLDILRRNKLARVSFQLANEAMLMQQERSRFPLRDVKLNSQLGYDFSIAYPTSPTIQDSNARWRAFQLGFILSIIPELVETENAHRENVDLIFFPTGGGKTEAYLGAAAFMILYRRLTDADDVGTSVIMRYTLRLLSAQQFLRAAALIAVLEDMRSRRTDLGSEPISIGIWVGSGSTPNTWEAARKDFQQMEKSPKASNRFLLLRCPWCGARFGHIKSDRRKGHLVGYERVGGRIAFICPDAKCRFGGRRELPVHVVDEGIYESRPTFLLGTVDKFAMLAWRPKARSIFGLGPTGERVASPPGLIIQDELHLISGPLGSMVGIYEPVIEELCTDRRRGANVRPKILAATATIRNFKQQVRSLYAREQVTLFPPNGLEQGHSFFSEPARGEDGRLLPGRRYVGIHAPALGSIQSAQVRTMSAALLGGMLVESADKDAYWTNVCFFNSLRELGNTVSLVQSDIPDYLSAWGNREGYDNKDVRRPRHNMELTSRRSEEIAKALEELEVSLDTAAHRTVDICLASSIIEVGVDIDRLSLMTIVGQPKTTAQYIQVSGRVGRRWWEIPGLVLTVYGASKPRDRSHYERFREYHERLYAGVEPTSLTPFAEPVVKRALHGSVVAYLRQSNPDLTSPFPFPEQAFRDGAQVIRDRASKVDKEGPNFVDKYRDDLIRSGKAFERIHWDGNLVGGRPKDGLMRFAGSASFADSVPMWEVPSSMRNVDAECQLRISTYYAESDGGVNQ